jgi:hypothetical protein
MNKLSFQCLKLQISNDIYKFQESIRSSENLKNDYSQLEVKDFVEYCEIEIKEYKAKIQYAKDILQQIKNIEDLDKE